MQNIQLHAGHVMAGSKTCSLAATGLVACLLLSLLPAMHGMVTQPKVERIECISKLKGAFTFDSMQTFSTEPGDVLTFTVVASDPSGSPLEFKWLVSSRILHHAVTAQHYCQRLQCSGCPGHAALMHCMSRTSNQVTYTVD
jgi:hypothetical protein